MLCCTNDNNYKKLFLYLYFVLHGLVHETNFLYLISHCFQCGTLSQQDFALFKFVNHAHVNVQPVMLLNCVGFHHGGHCKVPTNI